MKHLAERRQRTKPQAPARKPNRWGQGNGNVSTTGTAVSLHETRSSLFSAPQFFSPSSSSPLLFFFFFSPSDLAKIATALSPSAAGRQSKKILECREQEKRAGYVRTKNGNHGVMRGGQEEVLWSACEKGRKAADRRESKGKEEEKKKAKNRYVLSIT